MPPYVQEALLEATFDAVRNLVQAAIRNEVDFVVIAGDLYDMADRSLRAQLALQRNGSSSGPWCAAVRDSREP